MRYEPADASFVGQSHEIMGIPIRYDSQASGVAWARGIWPLKWIAVAPAWFTLSNGERQAALAHEVGHCRALHLERRLALLLFCWTAWAQRRAREHEFEADAFAVRAGFGTDLLRLIVRFRHVERDAVWQKLVPSPAERTQRIYRLMQECRNEPSAA